MIVFEPLRTIIMNNYTYYELVQDLDHQNKKDDSCFEVVEAAEVISWPESHFPTPPLGSNRPWKTCGRREMALGELE